MKRLVINIENELESKLDELIEYYRELGLTQSQVIRLAILKLHQSEFKTSEKK